MKKFIYILILLFISITIYANSLSRDYLNSANNAILLMKDGNTTHSVSILKEMVSKFGEDNFIRTAYGINMLLGHEKREAERIFSYQLSLDKKDIYANYCMGILSFSNKDYKKALEYFNNIDIEVKDLKTIKEYISLCQNPNHPIKPTEEESFNSIIIDGYSQIQIGDFANGKKFFDLVSDAKAENSFIESNGFLLSYDFDNPITLSGAKYGDNLGLEVANRGDSKTVSGKITVKADLSKVRNVFMIVLFVDEEFKGISNASPSFTLDTTKYNNGTHEIRFDALDYNNDLVSSTSYLIDIFNQVDAGEFFNEEYMYNELWDFIQLKTSQAGINYLTAICSAKLNDLDAHRFSLEKCVACNPDYKDAKKILKENYFTTKGRKSVERVKTDKKMVAITFDDGPTPNTTELLDILARYNAKATFFTVGKMAIKHPKIIKAMEEQGHQVALHSYNHLNLAKLNYFDIQKEIIGGYCADKSCGVNPTLYLRPPGGNNNVNVNRLADDYGVNIIMWTKNTTHLQQSAPNIMAEYCYNSLKPGFIYLFHNNVDVTTKALPMILSYFKSMGYECVTLDTLFKKN